MFRATFHSQVDNAAIGGNGGAASLDISNAATIPGNPGIVQDTFVDSQNSLVGDSGFLVHESYSDRDDALGGHTLTDSDIRNLNHDFNLGL